MGDVTDSEATLLRLTWLEHSLKRLESKVDRLTWALALAAVSFAGATAALLVSLAQSP